MNFLLVTVTDPNGPVEEVNLTLSITAPAHDSQYPRVNPAPVGVD